MGRENCTQQHKDVALIVRLSKERGFTQAALAKATGINESYLSGLKSGARPCTQSMLLRLEAGLNELIRQDKARRVRLLMLADPDMGAAA